MTIHQLFNEKIPYVLATSPVNVPAAVYNFKIIALGAGGGGDWHLNTTVQPPTCTPGLSPVAQCTVEITGDDFKSILLQPNLATQLYFTGKLKITGNVQLVIKLQPLFSLIA